MDKFFAFALAVLFPLLAAGGGMGTDYTASLDGAGIASRTGETRDAGDNTRHPVPDPVAYRATYKTSYNGLPVTTSRSLRREDGTYILSMEAKNFLGTISEKELFAIDGNGDITPRRYAYERSLLGQSRSETTEFNGDTAVNVYKETTVELPISDTTLGPMSYQFQMRQELMKGKEDFSYQVVSRNHIKEYRYRIIDSEMLDTPMGEVDTVVVERVRDNSERETYLWLARNLDYLPVKLIQKEDGDSYEMVVESYTPDPANL